MPKHIIDTGNQSISGTLTSDIIIANTVFANVLSGNAISPWDNFRSDVSTLSGNWQNTYTTVQANSATWATGTVLSGGAIYPIWGERNTTAAVGAYFAFGNAGNNSTTGVMVGKDSILNTLTLKLATAPSSNFTVRVYKNGASTSAVLTITSGNTDNIATGLNIAFNEGDIFAVRIDSAGGFSTTTTVGAVVAGWFSTDGVQGDPGPNIVTSTTSSDGTATLSVDTLSANEVYATSLTALSSIESSSVITGDISNNGNGIQVLEDVEFIGDLSAPSQSLTYDTTSNVITQSLFAMEYTNNWWKPWAFTNTRYTNNTAHFAYVFRTIEIEISSNTNCLSGSWHASIGNRPFVSYGQGNNQRFEHNFSIMFEMDTSTSYLSTGEHYFFVGFGRSGSNSTPDGTLPAVTDKCIYMRLYNSNVSLHLHDGTNVYSSAAANLSSAKSSPVAHTLGDNESYLMNWDGQSLYLYAAVRNNLASPIQASQPNWVLLCSIKAPSALTGTMGSGYWTFMVRMLQDAQVTGASFGPLTYIRRCIHPITNYPVASDPI
jgi:hypothetical protein